MDGITLLWWNPSLKCLMVDKMMNENHIDFSLTLLQEVLQRHPLHTIAQVVQYSDGGDTNNIAFKIGNVNKSVFSAYVFQCSNEVSISKGCSPVYFIFVIHVQRYRKWPGQHFYGIKIMLKKWTHVAKDKIWF